jgi:hypothetical protein
LDALKDPKALAADHAGYRNSHPTENAMNATISRHPVEFNGFRRASRWVLTAVAVGLFGAAFALSDGTEYLAAATMSAAEASTAETTVTVLPYRVLTVRPASIDDPISPQEPVVIGY